MSHSQKLSEVPSVQTASEAVVKAVADAENTDPLDLPVRLQEVVDGDALDRLIEPVGRSDNHNDVVVRFRMCGHDLAVHGDGRVYLDAALVETLHE